MTNTEKIQFIANSLLSLVIGLGGVLVAHILLIIFNIIDKKFLGLEFFTPEFIEKLYLVTKYLSTTWGIITILMAIFMIWEIIKSK